MVWEPKSNGDPWDDSWEPENYITEELKESFKSTLALSKQVRVDVAPLLTFVRQKVAHAVAFEKTQCRPREHFLPLECLSLQEIAVAFLELAGKITYIPCDARLRGGRGGRALPGRASCFGSSPGLLLPPKGGAHRCSPCEGPGLRPPIPGTGTRPYPACSHTISVRITKPSLAHNPTF